MTLSRPRFLLITLSAAMTGGWLPGPLTEAAEPAEAANYRPGPMLQEFLDGPMARVDEIIFAVRVPGRDHWYVTFGNYANHSDSPPKALGFKFEDGVYWGYGDGGRLCR